MSAHETVTPHPGADTAWHHTGRGGWLLVGMIGGEDYRSSLIVAIDPGQKLARTLTGKVRHVPGEWPDDLDLPAMRAPVRDYIPCTELNWRPHLAAYLTAECGGTWNDQAECTDMIPGVYLRGWPFALDVYVDVPAGVVRLKHPAAHPRAIAEALRDLPVLRAWLLSELDAARAVVGGAK